MAAQPSDDGTDASDGGSALDALTPSRERAEHVALERVAGAASSQGMAAASYSPEQPVAPARTARVPPPNPSEPAVIVEDLHTQPMLQVPTPSHSPSVPPMISSPPPSGGVRPMPPPSRPAGRRSQTIIVDRAALVQRSRRDVRDKVLAFVATAAVVGAVGVLVLVLRTRAAPSTIMGAGSAGAAAPDRAATAAATMQPLPAAPRVVSPAPQATVADTADALPSEPAASASAAPPAKAVPKAYGSAPRKGPGKAVKPRKAPSDFDELKSTIQK